MIVYIFMIRVGNNMPNCQSRDHRIFFFRFRMLLSGTKFSRRQFLHLFQN